MIITCQNVHLFCKGDRLSDIFWNYNHIFYFERLMCIASLVIKFKIFILGSHGRRNVSAELQMVAQYAAQVACREDALSSHSPEHLYRHPTSNGNSVNFMSIVFSMSTSLSIDNNGWISPFSVITQMIS